MTLLTEARLTEVFTAACKNKPNGGNLRAQVDALVRYGARFGLDRAHRLALFGGQILVESGEFRYDREIWGPTAAQERYDIRTDLGNTPERDGDGFLYRGRTPIQITGKANYREYSNWCSILTGTRIDFVEKPDLVLNDPWEGLAAIWYWSTRNLNALADKGDVEAVTRKINGGTNHLAQRIEATDRMGLVLIGYKTPDIKAFQSDFAKSRGLAIDGIMGPKSRAVLHEQLTVL